MSLFVFVRLFTHNTSTAERIFVNFLILGLFLIRSSFGWMTFYMKACVRFCEQLALYLLHWNVISTNTLEKTETLVFVVCFPVILTGFKMRSKRDLYSTSSSRENGLIVMTFYFYWRSLLDGPWCLRPVMGKLF